MGQRVPTIHFWAINNAPEGNMNRNRTAWFVLPEPLDVGGDSLTFQLKFDQKGYAIGRFRISVSDQEWIDDPGPATLAPLIAIKHSERSKEQQKKLDDAFLRQDAILSPLNSSLAESQKELGRFQRPLNNRLSNVEEWMEIEGVVDDEVGLRENAAGPGIHVREPGVLGVGLVERDLPGEREALRLSDFADAVDHVSTGPARS